ncbi:MAG TPA: ATP-binding protein, partial [Solirubrobacteraceae bacterium]
TSALRAARATAGVAILVWAADGEGPDPAATIEALRAGADAFLAEPIPPELLVATVRSLARRGAAARAAASVRARLTAGIDAVPIGVLLLDLRLQVIGANRQLKRTGLLLPYPERRSIAQAMPGAAGVQVQRIAQRVRDTGDEHAHQFMTEGVHWQLRAHAVSESVAGIRGIGITFEDVSELERTVAQLRANQQRWRAVFDSDRIGVCLRDAENRVIECNEAYAFIYEAPSAAAMVGTDLFAVLVPDDAARASEWFGERWRAAREPDVHVDSDLTLLSGRTVSVHSTVTIVRDAAGVPLHQLAMIENRTEEKRLAQELARTRRIEAVGRLAGGVAHDVNNMLAVIIGYTEIVAQRLGDAHELAPELREISRAAEHSRSLARDLLAFGRRQVLDRRALVPGAIVTDLRMLLEQTMTAAIALAIRDDSGGAVVVGDRAQLESVIVNLAANARDAMPDGGQLTIRIAADPPAPDRPDGQVTIAVTDTGRGMSSEVRDAIFEPFFTTKELGVGTGLGLATVTGIVEQMGGRITVDSSPGQGSTFVVALPRVPMEAGTAPAADDEDPDRPVGAGRTILVVEDEAQVRRLVELLLVRDGYTVITAASADEALARLRESGTEVDLLFTDMSLPDIRGGELARLALELRPGLRVVYTSGYAGDAVIRDGMPPGDGFLAKPWVADDLSRVLAAAWGPPPA